MKIIAACGNGMGTSMLIRIKVQKICKEMNLVADVEALSLGQAKGLVNAADIIVCSTHLAEEFDHSKKAKIIGVKNLMDENEIRNALGKVING